MKYYQKYPGVPAGTHSPDDRFYRTEDWRACAACVEMTNWVDVRLRVWVCSDECHQHVSTTAGAPQPSPASPSKFSSAYLAVVRRGNNAIFDTLTRRFAREDAVEVIWDRRHGDRRQATAQAIAPDRRHMDRRSAATWAERGYVIAPKRA